MPYGSINKIRDLLDKTEKNIGSKLVKEDQIELKKLLEEIRTEANYCADISFELPPIREKHIVSWLTKLYGKNSLNANEYEELMFFIKNLSKNEIAAFWKHFNVHNSVLSNWFYRKSPRCDEVRALILQTLMTPSYTLRIKTQI